MTDEHPDQVTDTGAGGHRFTLTSAAEACNTSKRTLLRHAGDLTAHGASKDTEGRWSIPYSALVASGFRVGAPRTGTEDDTAPKRAPDATDELRAELDAVRAALADAQRRAAVAEAVADERSRHIDSLRTALRAIEAAPAPPAPEPPPPAPPEPVQPLGWLRKLIP